MLAGQEQVDMGALRALMPKEATYRRILDYMRERAAAPDSDVWGGTFPTIIGFRGSRGTSAHSASPASCCF